MKHVFILIALFVLGFIGCEKTAINRETELRIIAKTIDNGIGWVKNKDLDLLYTVIANDSAFIEIHPSARIVRGFEEFKKSEAFWMSPDFQYVKHEINDLTINLSQSGTVAWFYCKLNDINTWKGQPANWENTRWTGVLEKREGTWVIVQQHFSFARE